MSLAERLRKAGEEALFDAIRAGETDTIKLESARKKAQIKETKRFGDDSEANFQIHVEDNYGIIPIKGDREDDRNGIDFWVPKVWKFILPAQIKSSPDQVTAFKADDRFLGFFNGKIIVIDCSESVTSKRFVREFEKEIDRIDRIRD